MVDTRRGASDMLLDALAPLKRSAMGACFKEMLLDPVTLEEGDMARLVRDRTIACPSLPWSLAPARALDILGDLDLTSAPSFSFPVAHRLCVTWRVLAPFVSVPLASLTQDQMAP